MNTKYLAIPIIALFLFSAIPMATATLGSYTAPAGVSMSGPLVDKVIINVYTDEASNEGALTGGAIQAAEWTFSVGAYTSLGTNPNIIEGSTTSYSWFGIAFNFAKYPGNDIHFRRAIQFMQDYAYITATNLQGVLGYGTPDPVDCGAYPSACNPTPMSTYYSYDLNKAGQELEMVAGVACNNPGPVPCAGVYSGASVWTCTGAPCGAPGNPFSPNLYYRVTLYRNLWGLKILSDAASIGFTITGHPTTGGGVGAVCFNPNGAEVIAPGSYIGSGPNAGYNTQPSFNATNVAADTCDM